MNKKHGILSPYMVGIILLAVIVLVGGSVSWAAVVKGNTAFALDLYQELKGTKGNLFFSPYSISTALAMTYGGARGNTAQEMAEVLHFPSDHRELHPDFARLEARLKAAQEKGEIQLNVANALWPQQGYPFLEEYLQMMQEYYQVVITPVDYKRAAEAARKKINQWVEEKPKNKIRDLVQPGILDTLTRLVLTNAIYFKGNWASRFDGNRTEEARFFLLFRKTAVRVPMMHQKNKFKYGEFDTLQILELPYDGNALSMLVFLPKDINGLPQLEKNLTAAALEQWTSGLREREVQVFLPKFKMTSQFRLGKTLSSMGMRDAFDLNKADFSGMDGRPNWLYIDEVIHKAFVNVNEEGTEAAAATAVVMKKRGPAPTHVFRADHPFLFLIRENSTGSILFMGRVVNPGHPFSIAP
jgi:serpin B